VKIERGKFSEGIQFMEQCQRISQKANFFPGLVYTPMYLSWIYTLLGETKRALDHAEILDELVSGFPVFLGRGSMILAKIHAMRGEIEEASSLVKRSLEQLEKIAPDMSTVLLLWIFAGEILFLNGELGEVRQIIEKIENSTREYDEFWCLPDLLSLKARLYFALGEHEEATKLLYEAKRGSERLGSLRSRLLIMALIAEYLASQWGEDERINFKSEAELLLEQIQSNIDDRDLRESFMNSSPVKAIQRI
jgi:ATP/maltotriose-dependent transcriptional regulator MalT